MKFRHLTLDTIEKLAKKKLPLYQEKWLRGASEYGFTERRNREIFRKISIIPKHLSGLKKVKLSKFFFGSKVKIPLLIAPMGGLTQFDKNAEKKIFKSANENKIIYCHSNLSRFSLTEILKKNPSDYFCSSLYIDQDFNYIKKKIKELDDFKINTVVITIDAPIRSISYDKMNYNYDARKNMRKIPKDLIQDFKREKFDPLKWEIIKKLRNITKKKIILKGILSCHDAKICRKIGIDGIWISNHGGRVLETDITGIEQLPEIKKIIKNKMTIICDGGVRTGTDFLKLLSLGADYVAIGRPIVYGLIFDKIKGVDDVLNLFCDELQTAAVLSGLKNLKDVDKLEKKINFNR